MLATRRNPFALLTAWTIGSLLLAPLAIAQPASRPSTRPADVFKATVQPQWLDATHFWYRNDLRGNTREFVVIDAEKGTREAAFDHAKLAEQLSAKSGQTYTADNLPIDIAARDASSVTIAIRGVAWKVDLTTYALTEAPGVSVATQPTTAATRPRGGRRGGGGEGGNPWQRRLTSPDGQKTIVLRDHNVFVREGSDGEPKQISKDGTEAFPYERAFWAPNSNSIVAYRMERGDHKPVYRIESSPRGANDAREGPVQRAILHTDEYALPGDKLDSFELNLFDATTAAQIKPQLERIDCNEWGSHPEPTVRWRPESNKFVYEKYDRGHQRLRVIEVDAVTGDSRDVLDERSETFIWTAHLENVRLQLFNYLANGKELIYISERSGWRHVYLVDLDAGTLKPITSGEWVVRGIDRIDEQKQQIWFNASGVYPGQDPYLIHYGRVNFDGSGLTWLTSSDGNHTVNFDQGGSFSPDGQFLVVTHSRVDSPPVTELRRVSDGKQIVELEKADVGESWSPPEVFVAKGRDDQTDIWGVITRPKDFDPNKKYPIIEDIYAGPQSSFTPKSFSARNRWADLADAGFIVVKLDGMGTANRSKAFHDVCWKNLKDAGFPDRIKWIKAAAEKYPYMDTTRVGIYGGSAGGQNAAGALLFHGDFYKVAVSNCGCHDNRMDKASWNEQWMGYPVGPHYSASSNIDNAGKLKGRLQLVLGELDSNVPVESTYRLVDALVKERKEFEFVLIPGGGHGAGSPITGRKQRDFFIRYLQGIEPPNPNE